MNFRVSERMVHSDQRETYEANTLKEAREIADRLNHPAVIWVYDKNNNIVAHYNYGYPQKEIRSLIFENNGPGVDLAHFMWNFNKKELPKQKYDTFPYQPYWTSPIMTMTVGDKKISILLNDWLRRNARQWFCAVRSGDSWWGNATMLRRRDALRWLHDPMRQDLPYWSHRWDSNWNKE